MKCNQKLKAILPAFIINFIRGALESIEFLWKRSYFSQFGEDAVLQNIFRSRSWQEASMKVSNKNGCRPGFYVDVGAFAPIQHSNTWFFYRKGWRGINIDATPGSMKIFCQTRPRDINLELAVSSTEGEITYYTWGVPNVMNTMSKDRAGLTTKQSGQQPREYKVKALTLKQILDTHLPDGQTIEFFTIDVENHNLEVLRSNDWKKYRPNFVLVETDDGSETLEFLTQSDMVKFLNEQGYQVISWIKPTLIFEKSNSN